MEKRAIIHQVDVYLQTLRTAPPDAGSLVGGKTMIARATFSENVNNYVSDFLRINIYIQNNRRVLNEFCD
jgi:hypothetical protein